MPRGNKDGSIIRQEAKSDPKTGRVIHRARILIKKRYRDSRGRPREKKPCCSHDE